LVPNTLSILFGRGQPLSFPLSFGEIPWFDEEGEIRRCDWSENALFCMCTVWIARLWVPLQPITAPYFPLLIKPRDFAKRQCKRQWLTPPNMSTDV